MNFLTFVFSLLLIFSLGVFVSLEKQSGDRRLRSTYLGHIAANRKILSRWEGEAYKAFRGTTKSVAKPKTQSQNKTPQKKKVPPVNPECARLNLWPLIQEGREEHPLLYDAAIKLLDTFYGPSLFAGKPQTKALFLHDFIKKAKIAIQKNQFCLEKLSLDPSFQVQYYKMLKGTKEWNLEEGLGYPSLLDMIKVEEAPSKICLNHAHPGQISALFGIKAGHLLYHEIHQDPPLSVTKDLIEQTCAKAHLIVFDPDLLSLIELEKSCHATTKKLTLIVKDGEVTIRKNIYTVIN